MDFFAAYLFHREIDFPSLFEDGLRESITTKQDNPKNDLMQSHFFI